MQTLRAEGFAVLMSPGAANYKAFKEELEAQDGLAAAVHLSHIEHVRTWCSLIPPDLQFTWGGGTTGPCAYAF